MENRTIILTDENLEDTVKVLKNFEGLPSLCQNEPTIRIIWEVVIGTIYKTTIRGIDILYKQSGFSHIYIGAEISITDREIVVKQVCPYDSKYKGKDASFIIKLLEFHKNDKIPRSHRSDGKNIKDFNISL